MVTFAKIVNNCNPLTISTKCSILDVLQGPEYASVPFSFLREKSLRPEAWCSDRVIHVCDAGEIYLLNYLMKITLTFVDA